MPTNFSPAEIELIAEFLSERGHHAFQYGGVLFFSKAPKVEGQETKYSYWEPTTDIESEWLITYLLKFFSISKTNLQVRSLRPYVWMVSWDQDYRTIAHDTLTGALLEALHHHQIMNKQRLSS